MEDTLLSILVIVVPAIAGIIGLIIKNSRKDSPKDSADIEITHIYEHIYEHIKKLEDTMEKNNIHLDDSIENNRHDIGNLRDRISNIEGRLNKK